MPDPTPPSEASDRPAREGATPPDASKARRPRAGSPQNPRPGEHQTFPARGLNPEGARELAILAARTLADDKCEHIIVLDVTELSQSFDFLVIASGTSDRQMVTAAESVAKAAKQLEGDGAVYGRSHDPRSTWIVLDMIDVVVHVFEPNTRAHYDLEMLWGDAPRVAWERPGVDARDHAGLHRPPTDTQ